MVRKSGGLHQFSAVTHRREIAYHLFISDLQRISGWHVFCSHCGNDTGTAIRNNGASTEFGSARRLPGRAQALIVFIEGEIHEAL